MFELILHHTYTSGGKITDLSGNGNDAQSNLKQVQGRNADEKALYFNGLTDRIIVPPSGTLNPLGGIRATAWIWLEELEQRRNILEGYLSFSLYVDPDGALCASAYNGLRWPHLRSAPNAIPLQQWICVTYIYDGINTSAFYLNNVLLALKYSYLRKVQGIQWPFGLNVGAWPDADSYMFKGIIAEVKIWRSIFI